MPRRTKVSRQNELKPVSSSMRKVYKGLLLCTPRNTREIEEITGINRFLLPASLKGLVHRGYAVKTMVWSVSEATGDDVRVQAFSRTDLPLPAEESK